MKNFSYRTMKELTSGDFSLYTCLIGGSSKYTRNNAYTVITVQAEVAQRVDNSYLTDKSLSSYSKNWCFKLWKSRQNSHKNSRIWCSRILKHRSMEVIVCFVGEIKEALFCLPLFIFIIYCKALGFLAILSIVWENFLKSRNALVMAVSWWSLSCPP